MAKENKPKNKTNPLMGAGDLLSNIGNQINNLMGNNSSSRGQVPQLEPQPQLGRPSRTTPNTNRTLFSQKVGIMPQGAPAPTGAPESLQPVDPAVAEYANLTKMLRRTYNPQLERFGPQVDALRQAGFDDFQGSGQVDRLRRRQDNSMSTIRGLEGYVGAEGIDPEISRQALSQYLNQEQALARFMPRNYRAPGKIDLINAVHTMAPQIEQQQYNTEAQDQWMQMAGIMQQVMMQDADLEYQQTMDKAGLIKDPDKQAQVMSLASTVYGLKQMQADALAAQQNTSQGKNSIASFLAAAQAGNTANTNKLYGGADTTEQTTGTQAYEDDFLQQILAGQ